MSIPVYYVNGQAVVHKDDHDRIVAAQARELEELKAKREHAAKANHEAWNEIRRKDMELATANAIIEKLQAKLQMSDKATLGKFEYGTTDVLTDAEIEALKGGKP